MIQMTNETRLSILMAYWKQKVKWDNLIGSVSEIHIDKDSIEFKVSYGSSFDWYYCSLSAITIPLRTISQMTDAELIEVAKIAYKCSNSFSEETPIIKKKYEDKWLIEYPNDDVCFVLGFDLSMVFYVPSKEETVALLLHLPIIEYLISIGVAVDMHGVTVAEMVDCGFVTIT